MGLTEKLSIVHKGSTTHTPTTSTPPSPLPPSRQGGRPTDTPTLNIDYRNLHHIRSHAQHSHSPERHPNPIVKSDIFYNIKTRAAKLKLDLHPSTTQLPTLLSSPEAFCPWGSWTAGSAPPPPPTWVVALCMDVPAHQPTITHAASDATIAFDPPGPEPNPALPPPLLHRRLSARCWITSHASSVHGAACASPGCTPHSTCPTERARGKRMQ